MLPKPPRKTLPRRTCCKNCTLPVIFTTSVFPRTKPSSEIGINVVKKPDFFYFYNLPRFDVVKMSGALKKYNISPTGNPLRLFARRACCKNCTLPVIFTTSVFTGRPLGRPFPQKSCEKVRFAGGIFAFFFNFSRILTHKLQQYPKFPQQIDILYAFLWGIARRAMPGSAHPSTFSKKFNFLTLTP